MNIQNKLQIIIPTIPDFMMDSNIESEYLIKEYVGNPAISLYQNKTHYEGHYLKYINKFNELIDTDKILSKINLLIKSNYPDKQRMLLILAGIKMFDQNSPIYRNSSQIYNHELYWNTISNEINSNQQFSNYFNKLFTSKEEFNIFYNKFINEGIAHFGSGWLWIYYNVKNNKLDLFTTHDSVVPFDNENMKILGVIDLWEHAYYLDYQANRKKYLEEVFKILNWKKLIYQN